MSGKVIWNNPRMKQIVGLETDTEVTQLTVADYHPAWALDLVKSIGIPTAFDKGTWIGQTALLTRGGDRNTSLATHHCP